MLLFAASLWVGLWMVSPVGLGEASPPGALTITSMGCYPSVSVDIRVSLFSTSPTKTNVLTITWSDGTSGIAAPPQVISADAVNGSQPTDTYHVDWLSDSGPIEQSPYTATATATLSWTSSNGNSKDVATTSLTEACGIA